ncbi:amy, partial [Symbiodinium sp. CCMP2456]
LLVNGQDASYALWAESLGSFSLEDGTAYFRGPTAILVNIGEINATTSTMEGPGRLLEGNVVGVPQPLLVQLKDQYGNNRIVTGSDFQQRRNGIAATLGDRELDTIVYDNGTIEVTVLAIQAGYHNLRVRIGAGCLFVPVRDPCEDISGSPTALLWWKEAEVSENGMTCQTPYAMEAGRQYHFTCTGRDVFGNINRDHELKLTSFFNYVADPEGFEPPDGWFRGNLSENFNQTVAGSYLASDGRYHFDITLYRAGFYQLIIEMVKVGSEPAIVLASNVLAEGRPAGEATYVLGFPSLPSFMSSVVGGFVTAVANVANEVSVQTRDRFGNAVETASSAEVVAQLRGRSPVQLSLLHLIQGRYRGALVPFAAGPTLLEIRVAGEEIVGSPFDFLVTPGPMVTTLSLVEGFPSELTAGVLSCWNITLRDATENHLLSGQFAGDPTQLEPVTCSDPGSYCFHTQLNGTFTCCINKTSVEEVPANYLVDTFPFTCQIRGDNIFAPENIKLWPHPVSPYWPDSSLKIGSGMLGPYDYPTFINEQFGWKDWPTNYFRRVQNVDSGQPQHQWNRLRLWYTDGFYNVFKGDNAAILLCDVKGPHSLGVKTLGQPTRPLYRLPYTLDQELGVFEVELKFEKAGYHKVFCSTAARGGMNVEYRDTDGSTFRRVVEGVNISALDQLPVDEQGGSARWDALLYPPTSANYTLILVCRGRDAVLIFNSSLRVTISTTDDTVDQEQLAVIGPLDLQAQTAYSVQVAWTSHSLSSSVQLRWSSDGGIPETILPAEYLYNSKTLLSGYPKTVNVSDVPGPVEAFERVQPFQNGKIRLRWMPPLESNGRPISSYRLRHDDGLGGDFTKEVRVEVSFLTFSEVIPASFTEVEVPVPDSYGNIDSLLDPTKLYRFELRASNDDRADRDFQVDGGGISDQPVVIALQPVEKAGAPLKPVLVESQEHEDGTGFIRIRISPPRETSGGLMVQYRVYASYILDGVFPPLELWAEGSTPLETVDVTLTDLTVGRTYVFEVAYLFSQGESARSPPLELICCYAAIPQAPRNLRRKSDTGGLPVQTDDRITVIWDAPTFAGVRDITHYKVSLTPVVVLQSSEKLRSSEVLRNTRSADDREMQFDSLSAGQTYALRVAAVSGAGDGPWSEEVVMPASGYSTEPRDLHVALQSNSSIHFAWGEPLRVGAGGLRGYSIYANVSTLAAAPAPYLVGQTVAGQNSFSFTGYSYVATDGRLRNVGLIPGRLYEVFVVAENAAGVGPASVSSTISAVAASKPSAPQAFAVDLEALSQGVVDLSWQMPSTDGDSPIDAYRVQRMKEWPGTFLSQCSVLLNNLGEPGGNCVIGDFAANGVGDTDLIEENPGQVRIYTGRIAVRNVAREAQSSVLCSIDVFGDPLFPTAEYDPGRDEPPLRECYVLVEVCADEPGDWHDADSDSFDCGWYAAEPGRCEIFGVRSPGLWNRTASEACCACGGGLKTNELKFCTKEPGARCGPLLDGTVERQEFGTCEFNSTIPAFGGLKADYTDGCSAFVFLRQASADRLHLTCHDSSRLYVHICKLKLALAPLPAAGHSTWLSMSPMRAWATIPLTLLAAADRGANWPPVAAKNAFVHLFEWSWQDVARECEEWLGPKGFSAVQVSPPMEHIQGQQWWTRYQPVTYNLTSRSGNEKDFRDMVSRCSKVGVSIIADAVVNHAAAGNGVGTAGSSYGGRSTAIYSQEDFHHNPDDTSRNCGVSNYNDKQNVQYCDLVGLPDLCTGCSQVQQVVAQYLSNLLQIGVAGFRIDAAKHMDAGELKKMLEQTQGGLPWVFQEVIEGGGEAVTPQMYTDIGKVTEFGYSRQLAPNFINEGKMKYLDTFGEKWGFMSGDSAAVFLDNHDTQRGEASLTYKSGSLYTLANIFMLAHPYGYPKVMSSYYFDDHDQGPPGQPVHGDSGLACGDGHPWVCEHRRPEIANMVAWRQSAGTEGLKAFQASDDGNSIVFCRGAAACVALNRGSGSWKLTAKLTLPSGKYRDVVRATDISACPIVEVKSDGSADLEVPSMSAVALHIGATEGSHNPFIISICALLARCCWAQSACGYPPADRSYACLLREAREFGMVRGRHQRGVLSAVEVVECSRAIGGRAEVTGVSDIAFSTQQFCYIVEKDQGGWRELRSASTFSTDLFYSDVRAVLSHRYQYRVYATNEAVAGSVLATPEISIVTGGLPDPPETVVLGSDQMTVRIAWIEPPGQGLKVEGYRVYVDGKLAYDGATDSVTREFTLLNCTRGELRDLAVAAVNAGGETLVPTVITRHCARRPFKPEPPTIVYVDCVKEATPDRMLIDNHIRIAYKEPEDNGGVPLTGWRIQRAQGESLAFRGVGPLFPIPENEVWFDDFNDLDGAGKIGLVWGEIYKYRVVAVNDIDIWDDESASDYTIVRCSNEAPEVPWWLQLNASTTTTTTTAADNQTFAADLVTGFVWSVEATTTTTTLTAMESSYAFAKLADVDPRDCYLPQNVTEEPFNFSATIVEALEAFDPPPAPTLSVAWSACNTSVRKGDPCKEFFPDRSDVVACARLEFRPTQPANISCPVEWYEIERNEELIATVRPSQNGLVDAYTADTFTASHYDGFFGTRFTCFQTIPNRDLHDKQLYRIRAQNCRGWGAWSEELPVPVAAPPAPVCGLWGFTSDFQYTCTQPGLSVTPLNDTSAEFQWTLLQDAQLVDVANNFSRIQADIGQVGPGDFVTFSQQLIGSYDPRALLGYRLLLDDGLGGPFHLAYDGIGRRLTNTAKIFGLMPERTYRAFVRAVSFVGEGNASDMVYFKMAMPLPAPVNLSVSSVSLKSVMLTWKMPYAETADALPVSQYIVQMAMEPDFSNWFDVQNSPADNTEYSILVTQLEADFRYALRVMANSENGLGHTSESLYFWAGLLPNEGPRLVQRIESDAGTIKIQWERPGGAMLGTGTRMEAVTTDWGARGYMWDPAMEDPRLVFDGLGHADTVQFTVANATCGGQYKVAMTTVTTIGEGPFSTALDVTNARLPGVPRNVVITNTTTSSISIAWEEPEDTGCVPIHQYRILRYYPEAGFRVVGYATPADGLLQVPANRTYVDDGRCFFASPADDDGSCTCPPSCLQAGQLYRYQIQACVLGAYGVDTLELPEGPLGCGPNSNTVSAYAADLSEAPRDIRLGEPEGSQILLYWTAPSTDGLNGSSFTYEIEMDVGGVFTTLGLTTDTSFLISGLQLQFAYIFRISTYNSAGYVTRSNGIGYTATLPPAVPEPASPIPRPSPVSSAFFQHPSMASTPVPEGVSLRFSATAVNGYAWAMVVESSNLDMVSATTMKDGTYAVGGAACYRAQQAVARGEVYFWRLGSDDNPSDPTGCFLSHGGTYAIATYVQSVASFDAGLNDGTLSGPIEFTVVSGLSNTFYSSPTLNSPLTESGVTLAFTPRRPGYGWAMILTEEQARSATKEHVYRLDGALGGPFCRHGPRQLFANREEAWVFSGCLLTVGNRYTVLAYISGIGAHLDGTVDGASSTATSASNAFSTFPTISGPPSGDGITVQLRTRSSGYLWLMITVGPVALTIDLIKAGVGAVGASTCRVLAATRHSLRQSFDLSDCKLNSGPEYALHSYIEGTTSSGNDGSFAGTVTFQVTPSNIFVVYPSIISETTGLGFTFQMTASFAGRFWLLLREGNAAITVEEIKSGTGALGLAECQRSSEVLTASLQELVLTNCQLSQDRLYSLYVYIEDFNGNGDGIIAGPISFYVLEANNFEDSPLPVENSATLDGVRLSFMASREGFAWAALFEDYAEAVLGRGTHMGLESACGDSGLGLFSGRPHFPGPACDLFTDSSGTVETVASVLGNRVLASAPRYYPTNNESCAPAGVPVLASGNITNMTLADCGLNYSATYWAVVYIEGGRCISREPDVQPTRYI